MTEKRNPLIQPYGLKLTQEKWFCTQAERMEAEQQFVARGFEVERIQNSWRSVGEMADLVIDNYQREKDV